jgi:hypothetical protein
MVNGPAVDEPEIVRNADLSEEPDELTSERPAGRRSLWSRRSRANGAAGTMFDEVAGDDGGEEGAPDRARGVPWPIVAVVGLCALALVLALVALQQHSRLQDDRNQTRDLKQVSGQLVGALTTYDYQHLSDWQNAVLAHATGSFRNGFNERFPSVQKLLTATHNRATSTVQGIYVGDVQGGRASTVVIVNVTVTGLSGTRQFGSYDKLTVLKVNGRWQVDDIETLNFDSTTGTAPQGGSAPASSASSVPAPTTPSTAKK